MSKPRKKRMYILFAERAVSAMLSGIDCFNRVYDRYKVETCLILMTNGWELLAKAVLTKRKQSIDKDSHGNTISAEVAVSKIRQLGLLDENQEDVIQQVISLRNAAIHNVLPLVPIEITHHLFFFNCKFFAAVLEKEFPRFSGHMNQNFLSISLKTLTTYADKVQKLVGQLKRNKGSEQLVWLLERGIRFEGVAYLSQNQFETEYRRHKRILPHLAIGDFVKNADMVRIVAIQAPRNFTADINLRKGSAVARSLPVSIKKTNMEEDYPYLTNEIAAKLGKTANFVAFALGKLNYKGNPKYHQSIRSSRSSRLNRYSEATINDLKAFLSSHPSYSPFRSELSSDVPSTAGQGQP